MTEATQPTRPSRLWPVLGVLIGAPVTAELVQSYLDITGDLGQTLFLVVFMAPLYGGAALLIREVAVHTGRGWPGILLLAGAFGLSMPVWSTSRCSPSTTPTSPDGTICGHRPRPWA